MERRKIWKPKLDLFLSSRVYNSREKDETQEKFFISLIIKKHIVVRIIFLKDYILIIIMFISYLSYYSNISFGLKFFLFYWLTYQLMWMVKNNLFLLLFYAFPAIFQHVPLPHLDCLGCYRN